MEIEKVVPVYQVPQLVKRDYNVYRVSTSQGRLYYRFEGRKPKFFISLTTMIKATMPTAEHLIKWMCDMGYDEAKRYARERADYGTAMHIEIGNFITSREVNMKRIEDLYPQWADDLKSDLLAFAQFVKDYSVVPMAIEVVLTSKKGYATCIDLVCSMVIKVDGKSEEVFKSGPRKGEQKDIKVDKEIVGLINFKSGRKGFHEENEVQLQFEKMLFEENYPEIKVDRIYNWSPKEWRDGPSYNLKDQTESVNLKKIPHILGMAKIELMKRMPSKKAYPESVQYGSEPKMKIMSLEKWVVEKHNKIIEEERRMLEEIPVTDIPSTSDLRMYPVTVSEAFDKPVNTIEQ